MNNFKSNIIKAAVCIILIGISYISLILYCLMGWSMLGWEKVTEQVLGIVIGLGWIVLFCLIVYIIKQNISKKVIIIICIYICLLTTPIIASYVEGNYYKTFSKSKWRGNSNARFLMEEDLYKKYDIKSLSKEEIINFLGEEEEEICSDIRNNFQKNCKKDFMVLWLGKSDYSIKRYMVIIFDGNSVEDIRYINKYFDPI
ncbi:hypothetical protein [Oceanirhabdus sp. W0125-5]|uniref:hypothetical protein n=1 Tax=Oceanirhabdus sp. W0125-5 TaxID=2999116 RepID=UPI0022F2DA9A|nr:hypothetical protein [Oceanirhabdus sp. W0125-5]WBW97527.1 hypothetical protein OW730_01535 [Oceanirhabdus sp. W0125-5]